MQFSGKGRHRRPTKTARLAAVTGLAGASVALPLLSATGAQAAPANNWDQVAQCESGGNWSTSTGNGFSGGLQFTQQTWAGHGGTQYAPTAAQASKSQQIQVAEKVLASQGKGAWPNCGKNLGAANPGAQQAPQQQSRPAQPQQQQERHVPQQRQAQPQEQRQAQPQQQAPQQQSAPVRQAPQQTQPSQGGTYTVKSGDTLGTIAAAHGTNWQTVYQNNKSVIGGDPNLILPGQQLHI